MSLKERIENSPALFVLGSLVVGFGAGVGAYNGILRIAKLRVVSQVDYDEWKAGQATTPFTEGSTPNLLQKAEKLVGDYMAAVERRT